MLGHCLGSVVEAMRLKVQLEEKADEDFKG
jgi:hypothetical protein